MYNWKLEKPRSNPDIGRYILDFDRKLAETTLRTANSSIVEEACWLAQTYLLSDLDSRVDEEDGTRITLLREGLILSPENEVVGLDHEKAAQILERDADNYEARVAAPDLESGALIEALRNVAFWVRAAGY
jgi:hypothetical protein